MRPEAARVSFGRTKAIPRYRSCFLGLNRSLCDFWPLKNSYSLRKRGWFSRYMATLNRWARKERYIHLATIHLRWPEYLVLWHFRCCDLSLKLTLVALGCEQLLWEYSNVVASWPQWTMAAFGSEWLLLDFSSDVDSGNKNVEASSLQNKLTHKVLQELIPLPSGCVGCFKLLLALWTSI